MEGKTLSKKLIFYKLAYIRVYIFVALQLDQIRSNLQHVGKLKEWLIG